MEAVLWLFFMAIFAYLAFPHWKLSELGIEISKLYGSDQYQQIRVHLSSETPPGVIASIEQFNLKFRELNRDLVWGYLAATGTALLSFIVAVFTK